MSTTTESADRAKFEAWFESLFDDKPIWEPARNCYSVLPVHMAWKGWQAALRAQAADRPPTPGTEWPFPTDGAGNGQAPAQAADRLEEARKAQSCLPPWSKTP